MSTLALVLTSIEEEVQRARKLHPSINSLHEAYAVIMEEVDEFWDEVKINPRKLSPQEARDRRIANMKKELVQVAAMCIRTIIDCNLEKEKA